MRALCGTDCNAVAPHALRSTQGAAAQRFPPSFLSRVHPASCCALPSALNTLFRRVTPSLGCKGCFLSNCAAGCPRRYQPTSLCFHQYFCLPGPFLITTTNNKKPNHNRQRRRHRHHKNRQHLGDPAARVWNRRARAHRGAGHRHRRLCQARRLSQDGVGAVAGADEAHRPALAAGELGEEWNGARMMLRMVMKKTIKKVVIAGSGQRGEAASCN